MRCNCRIENGHKINIKGGHGDEDQGEQTLEGQDQQNQAQFKVQTHPMSTSSIMPQRITRSKAQALGDGHQLMSHFVISLE